MNTINKDLVVIGSGFGAAPPAMRLPKAGWDVAIIEKGPGINPYADFKQTQNPKYLLRYLKTLHGPDVSLNYVEAEGGGSGFYEHISLRPPSFIFSEKDDFQKQHWPAQVNRKVLDPYFEIGEYMLKVHQIPEHEVPKTGQVFALLMKKLGYSTERSRYAVENCVDCGRCITGCVYGAKQSLLLNYLPAAVQAGAQMYTETEVTAIRPLKRNPEKNQKDLTRTPYRYEVITKPAGKNGVKTRFRTKVLILAAGTLGTCQILLKSQSQLPQLSSEVGKNVTFNGSVKSLALLPDWCPDADLFVGRSNPGILSYEFLESDHFLITAANLMPLQLLGSCRVSDPNQEDNSFWGPKHMELMKKMRKRMILLVAMGLAKPDCRFSLDENDNLVFSVGSRKDLDKLYKNGKNLLDHIILKSKCKILKLDLMSRKGIPYDTTHFTSSHPLGSCRMAESVQRGVVNYRGEVFGYPGMYVTDGAAISGPLIVNPSLTILANAERITDIMIKEWSVGGKKLNLT
jgi:choline dehydrogenase-like flavoprotein